MSDKEGIKEEAREIDEAIDAKKLTSSLLLKIGSGTILMAVLGYAASWAFVTLNALEEGLAKTSEKLEMIEKGVEKDREDKAQWKQIMIIREKTSSNDVEIRVLKKLYDFHMEGHKTHSEDGVSFKIEEGDVEMVNKLQKELMNRKDKKIESLDDFKNQSMQQIVVPQQKEE